MKNKSFLRYCVVLPVIFLACGLFSLRIHAGIVPAAPVTAVTENSTSGHEEPVFTSPVIQFIDWVSGSQFSIRWTGVEGADGYILQYGSGETGAFTKLAVNKGDTNVRAIVKASRGKIRYYRVMAYRKVGEKREYSLPSDALPNIKYKDSHLGELFPSGPPKSAKKMRKKYLTKVRVPIWSKKKKQYMTILVHRKLKKKIKRCFQEMYKIRFPIDRKHTGTYCWRKMRTANLRSHHSYGCVVDINWKDNPMVSLSKIKTCSYQPGENKYSITQEVVRIWEKEGFSWGGSWTEKKDFMHLTYTNN